MKQREQEYYHLQKKLKSKVENSSLDSSDVIEVSKKIDEYILQAMKELNFDN